jgi:hypothetical protein
MTRRVGEETRRIQPHRTWLLHLLTVVVALIAYKRAPDAKNAMDEFFPAAAQISATLLVAVALFGGALSDPAAIRVRRWIGPFTFMYLGVATAGAALGSVGTVTYGLARWLFALTCGAGAAGLLTVLLIGNANVGFQKARSAAATADKLDPPGNTGSVSGLPGNRPHDARGDPSTDSVTGNGPEGLDTSPER